MFKNIKKKCEFGFLDNCWVINFSATQPVHKATVILKPPVWALISRTSPAKCKPRKLLAFKSFRLIYFKSTPPLVKKDFERHFPATLIGKAFILSTSSFSLIWGQFFDFFQEMASKNFAKRSGTSILRVFLSDFSRCSSKNAKRSSVDILGITSCDSFSTFNKTRHAKRSRSR